MVSQSPSSSSRPVLSEQVLNRAGSSPAQRPDFWYSVNTEAHVSIAAYAGQHIQLRFENQQQGTSDQALYLDNIRIE